MKSGNSNALLSVLVMSEITCIPILGDSHSSLIFLTFYSESSVRFSMCSTGKVQLEKQQKEEPLHQQRFLHRSQCHRLCAMRVLLVWKRPAWSEEITPHPEQAPHHVSGAVLIDLRGRIEGLGCLKLVNPNAFLLLVSEMVFL